VNTAEPLTVPSAMEADDIDLLGLAIVVAKRKTIIAAIVFVFGVVSVIGSLLLPNSFVATARLMPPQQNQSTAALLLGQLSGIAGLSGSPSLAIKNPNDLYVGMLKSRTVADSVIDRFRFREVYGTETMVETREKLASNVSIAAGKDGLITIEFEDQDAGRAAAVANAYAEGLHNLTRSLALTEAAQRRLFFEQQLKQTKEDLAVAELALKQTQEKTGLIKMDDQGRAIIEAVAALRAQISTKEIELRSMRTFATEGNPDYVRNQQQLAGLRIELAKLESAQLGGAGDIFLPTGKVPEAGLEYLRKYRDVKYQEAIFELLARQFEVAKIDEAKEAAIVQVVDRAIPPDRKSKPKRALIVVALTLIGGVVAVLTAFVLEARERLAVNPDKNGRLSLLRHYLSIRGPRKAS